MSLVYKQCCLTKVFVSGLGGSFNTRDGNPGLGDGPCLGGGSCQFWSAMGVILAETGAWILTGILLMAGLAGVFLPFLPGHLLIFIAAIVHWWILGEDAGYLIFELIYTKTLLFSMRIFYDLYFFHCNEPFSNHLIQKWQEFIYFLLCVNNFYYQRQIF